MADTIRGLVTNIVDGDTFDMKVTHVGKNNKYEYNDEERVRSPISIRLSCVHQEASVQKTFSSANWKEKKYDVMCRRVIPMTELWLM